MIYCNLKGGLANMLFQIAAAKSMSIDKGIDCSFPNFMSQLKLINDDSLHNPSLKHSFEYMDMFRSVIHIQPAANLNCFHYPFQFIELDLPSDNFMIDGFFQSEKYFSHNRNAILDFFEIPDTVKETIDHKYSAILTARTTSIHVRRGDYLKFPEHHPVQSIEYYDKCVDVLKDETDMFVVFSDDIEWCKENLQYENTVYIENEKDYVELYLMSLCNNNITCNSSFSWWGAWLNENPDKIVIGPKIWFGPALINTFASYDIIPETWIKI